MPCTAPEVRAIMPTQTETQQKQRANADRRVPTAASARQRVGLHPEAEDVAEAEDDRRTGSGSGQKSASTAPTSGAERAIGSDRNRSKTPFSMSALRFWPSATPAIAMPWPSRPGSRYCR